MGGIGLVKGIIGLGAIIGLFYITMVSGGGIALLFLKIPWYVWAFGLLLLILWFTKK